MTLKGLYHVSDGVTVLDNSISHFTIFGLKFESRALTQGIFICL